MAIVVEKYYNSMFFTATPVEVDDTIYISISVLCLSFHNDQHLLQTVEGLVHRGSSQTPVKKECDPNAPQARPEQGRHKVSPVQGGAQLFLSYRVPETGRREQGGDCTVLKLKSALEAYGYSVFVGESDIEGGASWVQTIQVAITDCQVFIPICSKTYGDTKWTLRELHEADEANKEILPLWHSGDYPPKKVSLYLRSVQRLPRGNQPLVQADFQSLVSDLVAAIKKTGPTEEALAIWWERLKAAPAVDAEKAKELCASGKLKVMRLYCARTHVAVCLNGVSQWMQELAYEGLDAFVTLLDTGGRSGFGLHAENYHKQLVNDLIAGDQAASLLSGVCKCVHGAHVNKTKLEKLRDRCLDLLDLLLYLGGIDAFISTCRSSSELPRLPKEFMRIMCWFNAIVEKVNAYCEKYTGEGIFAGYSRSLLYHKHKEDYEELVTELGDLRDDVTFTLDVYQQLLEEVEDDINAGMPPVEEAKLVAFRAQLKEDMPFVMDKKLEEHLARLDVRDYSILLHQPHLEDLWSKHFMREQAVSAGWGHPKPS
ncbi:hypothetical protein QJQ45_004576 [Haematococcus lacustris]|nr:hypothetical protein QJQ45_004576 [Haematococcus lacustris]